MLNVEPIKIFNDGDFESDLYRDFTHIDDIVVDIVKLIPTPPTEKVKHEVYNVGNNNPVKVIKYITALKDALPNKLDEKV